MARTVGSKTTCSICGGEGHNKRTCSKSAVAGTVKTVKRQTAKSSRLPLTFNTTRSARTCSYCQSPYHTARTCFVKKSDFAQFSKLVDAALEVRLAHHQVGLGAVVTLEKLYNNKLSFDTLKNVDGIVVGLDIVKLRRDVRSHAYAGLSDYGGGSRGCWTLLFPDHDGKVIGEVQLQEAFWANGVTVQMSGDVAGLLEMVREELKEKKNALLLSDAARLEKKPWNQRRSCSRNREWTANQAAYIASTARAFAARVAGSMPTFDSFANFKECAAYWNKVNETRPVWPRSHGWLETSDQVRYETWI